MSGIFHANFRATDPRPSRQNQSVKFGAAGSGAAEAVAAELQNWTTGQLTSVTGNVGGQGFGQPYPVGTRLTVQAICSDVNGKIVRVNVRNATAPTTGNLTSAVTAWLLGTAYADSQYTVLALGSAPIVPASGGAIVTVNKVSIITKY